MAAHDGGALRAGGDRRARGLAGLMKYITRRSYGEVRKTVEMPTLIVTDDEINVDVGS